MSKERIKGKIAETKELWETNRSFRLGLAIGAGVMVAVVFVLVML